MRFLARTALVLAVVLGIHALAYAVVPDTAPIRLPLVACATEDSTNCVWNADTQGNGQGHSFIDLNGTAYCAHP